MGHFNASTNVILTKKIAKSRRQRQCKLKFNQSELKDKKEIVFSN